MSVAAHLGIRLTEYDARIRTFIPDYEEMLDAASAAVPASARTIVDLGIGTGALAARCLVRYPRARIVGIDEDSGMAALAARRLGDRARFVAGSFLRLPIPQCDAIVASLALHHVRTRLAKRRLYARLRSALARDGRLVVADCHPSSRRRVALLQREAWLEHLRQSYSNRESRAFFKAWAREDVYVPLDAECALMRAAGFQPEVLWRKGAFAVLVAAPGQRRVRSEDADVYSAL